MSFTKGGRFNRGKRPLRTLTSASKVVQVTNYRSPVFLLFLGGITFVLSVGIWLLRGETTLTWTLMVFAFPPIFEGAVSRQFAQFGAVVYSKDTEEVERLAYQPFGALLRCCYLFCWVATVTIFGRAGYNILPDNWKTVVVLIAPPALYITWAGASYWKSIASVARQEKWSNAKNDRAG